MILSVRFAALRPAVRRAIGRLALAMAAALPLAGSGPVLAQNYPTKPLRLIVPYAPGGGVDFVGRQVGQRLSEMLGQSVVIDNRPGAGAIIGVEQATHAPADGYTLLVVDPALLINPMLQTHIPYDWRRELRAVSMLTLSPLVLSTPASSPAGKSLTSILNYAREHPGQASFASAGVGTTPHMAGELLKLRSHTDLVHIPYKGSGPAMADLVAGRVTMAFSTIAAALPFLRDGKLDAVATSGVRRAAALPDVPTVAQSGLANFEVNFWTALFVPAGVSPEVMGRLNAATQRVLAGDALRDAFAKVSETPMGSSAADAAAMLNTEADKWSRVVSEGHITATP